MHVHGVVFVGWLAVLTAQVLLIRRRRPDLHRKLGVAAMGLAVLMVIIGPAGSDMHMLPPTVAEFHTLNDARKASQLVLSSDPASQSAGGSNS